MVLECTLEMRNGEDGFYRMNNNYFDCFVLEKSPEVLAMASRKGIIRDEEVVIRANSYDM